MKIMFGLLERACLIFFLVTLTSIIINGEKDTLVVLMATLGALYVIFGSGKDALE